MKDAPYSEIRKKNNAAIFRSTVVSMILFELTGAVAVMGDGIISSQGLGVDAYSGISLVKPFAGLVLLFAAFLSTGCNIVCSRLTGAGRKEEANEAFNLSAFLLLAISALIIIFCLCFPNIALNLCGIKLDKYPELNQHVYGYLHGYLIGVPALMLIQVFGPILVMDGGKRSYTLSGILMCAVDIIGDLLNVYMFHGGAFGVGLATSAAFIIQLAVMLIHFLKRSSYFRISWRACSTRHLKEIVKNGNPALVRKLSGTLGDIFINYINLMIALSTVAIAAKGIQNDIFLFLFCIPTGLGRTLITMTGIYYSANDLEGLKQTLIYAVRTGLLISGAASAITFAAAPLLCSLYTSDPEVISLAAFSIRWLSVAQIFDTSIILVQYYLQGTDNLGYAGILSVAERAVVPPLCALVLGLLFGSKGVLASVALNKFIMILVIFLADCIRVRGIPRDWIQVMFLPEGFGGPQADNFYAEIRTGDDAVKISEQTRLFCREHHIDDRKAFLTALCVEEMATNVIEHAERKGTGDVCIDYHLFIGEDDISIRLMDLSDQFDPTIFYEQHRNDAPGDHIGIRMVTNMAKDIRYYTTFKANTLMISI